MKMSHLAAWTLGVVGPAVVAHGQAASPAQVAAKLGITARGAAAIGLGQAGTQVLLQRIVNNSSAVGAFLSAQAQLESCMHALVEAESQLRPDPTDVSRIAAVRTARGNLLQARAQAESSKQSLRQLLLAGVPEPVVARIQAVFASRSRRCPIEFGVAPRTGSQWTKIAVALAAERQSLAAGQSVPADVSSLLTTIRAESEVVAAQSAVSTSLSAVATVFQSFGPD